MDIKFYDTEQEYKRSGLGTVTALEWKPGRSEVSKRSSKRVTRLVGKMIVALLVFAAIVISIEVMF